MSLGHVLASLVCLLGIMACVVKKDNTPGAMLMLLLLAWSIVAVEAFFTGAH